MIKYVMDVQEPREPETGIGGTLRRFEYADEATAWDAYKRALAAGFTARVERVQATKQRVNA